MNIREQLSELNKMSKRSVALYHKFANSIGISDSSLGVLYALAEGAPCSQYDLCNKWAIKKQTVNTALASLQNKGFITLSTISGTRKKKSISLTAAGKEFAAKTINVLLDTELAALASLTPEERELYISLNKKYNEHLTEKLQNIIMGTS